MEIKKYVGEKSGLRSLDITEKLLVDFARSLEINEEGSADPKTQKALAAEVSQIRSTRSLPTFLTYCREGEFEVMSRMGVQLQQVLHGEQEYSWDSDIEVGDSLQYETRVAQVMDKRSGSSGKSMHFIVLETQFQVVKPVAKKIGSSKTTIVYRE